MNSGGETEPAAEQRPGAPPQDFPNLNVTTPTQNASPSTDDSKTPAVSVKKTEPASAQPAPTKTTAKKPKRRRRRTS
ncbi:MAG TPA: hypothetical protein VGP08_19160 [Pyrinomonadaceae bacterium]|jgi:hypothetical protein|nr:hypothetical protein [Pyrinomonadaceae bacterium]